MEISNLNLVADKDPILHTRVDEFDFKNPPVNPLELKDKLCEILDKHNALGLSANQVGLPYRVFVTKGHYCFFNPRMVDLGDEQIILEEGCLSFPNVFPKIKRPRRIRMRAANEHGDVVTHKFHDLTARICLHEYDHLEGKTFDEAASKFSWERAIRKKKLLERRQKNV